MSSSRSTSSSRPESSQSGDSDHGFPWRDQAPLGEQRHTIHGRGPLGVIDVFALIVNKMIGTGIYTAPASVFLMTGNKLLTLSLFAVGFIYTVISMLIYLDYARVLPYTGGELIYLDEISSHVAEDSHSNTNTNGLHNGANLIQVQAMTANGDEQGPPNTASTRQKGPLLGDGLLVFIIYSISFILVFNSGTNSMQFGRMILLFITAGKPGHEITDINEKDHIAPLDVNHDLMRFIGVFILSLICLLQFFSPRFGRSLNKTLAFAKIGMLVGLFVVGSMAADSGEDRWHDWIVTHQVDGKGLSIAKAFLAVLFSFQGWENATFVTGEIQEHRVLRKGFIWAVWFVGFLYLGIVIVFLHFIHWDMLIWETSTKDMRTTNPNYAPMFTGDSARSRRAWAAMAAISAFGSLNAIIYTFSRVKQAIGHAEILPWSRFWKQDNTRWGNGDNQENHDPWGMQNDRAHEFLYKSPQGGLILHWTVSTALILATVGIGTTAETVEVPGNIQTYIHCAALAFLGIRFYKLESLEQRLSSTYEKPSVSWWRLWVIVPTYVLVNLAVLVVMVILPHKTINGLPTAVRGYVFPSIACGLLFVSTAYYFLFFGAASRTYEHVAASDDEESSQHEPSPPLELDGRISRYSLFNWMQVAQVQCEIMKNYEYDEKLERVHRFGRRWRIVYNLPGDPRYQAPASQQAESSAVSRFFYWLFGGSRLPAARNPPEILGNLWADAKTWLRNRIPGRK